MWGHDGMPGAASPRTLLENVEVTDEAADDHFYDLIRQATGRVVRSTCPRRCATERAIGLVFASVVREVYPYGANGVEVRTISVYQWRNVLDSDEIGPLERSTPPVIGGVAIVAGETWLKAIGQLRYINTD